MSFSSGTFSLYLPGNPVVTGTSISSSWANNTLSDIATGLSTCILKDGSQTITANVPWGGYKITGLGAATARTDAASIATIQDGTGVYVGTVGGTADVITLTPSPAITAYASGQTFRWIASGANTTNVTVAISGLTAKPVTKNGSTALVAGDIPSGSMVTATFDGTRFIIGTVGLGTFVQVSTITAAGGMFVGTAAATVGELPATANVAANATTSNIWGAREIILTGGAVTFTDVADAPYAGAVAWVKQNAAHVWTTGGNFTVQGGANYTAASGDWVRVYATSTTAFEVTVFPVSGATAGGANQQIFNASGTWTKPTGYSPNAAVYLQAWGGGGSGGKGSVSKPSGGGGGGGYTERWVLLSQLGGTETITLGDGGAAQTSADTAGNAGGNTTIGALLTAYGGGGGGVQAGGGGGGGGGGLLGAGGTASGQQGARGGRPSRVQPAAGSTSGGTLANNPGIDSSQGGGNGASGDTDSGQAGFIGGFGGWGGGGGGSGSDTAGNAATNAGGSSLYGGGGGGGAANSVAGGNGGASNFGGAGSAGAIDNNSSSDGTQPGGGSGGVEIGGDSGAGGKGKVIITVIA